MLPPANGAFELVLTPGESGLARTMSKSAPSGTFTEAITFVPTGKPVSENCFASISPLEPMWPTYSVSFWITGPLVLSGSPASVTSTGAWWSADDEIPFARTVAPAVCSPSWRRS